MMESALEEGAVKKKKGKRIKKHERERKTAGNSMNGTKAFSPVCTFQEVAVRF
jgi:hypothetical protein